MASDTIWLLLLVAAALRHVRFFCSLIINPPQTPFCLHLPHRIFLRSLHGGRQVHLCHALAISTGEAQRASRGSNVTPDGWSAAFPFDPGGATEGRTLTNTCQTKLLGTKESIKFPLDVGQRGRNLICRLTHTPTHTHGY